MSAKQVASRYFFVDFERILQLLVAWHFRVLLIQVSENAEGICDGSVDKDLELRELVPIGLWVPEKDLKLVSDVAPFSDRLVNVHDCVIDV